jgi:hypothetical protein
MAGPLLAWSVGRWCLIGSGGPFFARETFEAFGRTTGAKSLFSYSIQQLLGRTS